MTIAADGSYSYTPAANFNGTDSVDYTVTDGSLTDVGTLTINVTAVNDAPVATDDAVTATEDTVLNFNVSSLDTNDTDLDGDALVLLRVLLRLPRAAVLILLRMAVTATRQPLTSTVRTPC